MKRFYSKEDIACMWEHLEITIFDDMAGMIGYKPITGEEFAAWTDEEMISMYEKIYPENMDKCH